MIYHDLTNVHKHEKCQFVCQKGCLQKVLLGFEIQQVSLKQKLNEQSLHSELCHQLLVDIVSVVSWIERVSAQVEDDGEDGTGGVHSQSHPPDQLLVQFLLKVLEHEQTDGEAGQGASQMRHVADRWPQCLRCVPVIHCKPHIGTGWNITEYYRDDESISCFDERQ